MHDLKTVFTGLQRGAVLLLPKHRSTKHPQASLRDVENQEISRSEPTEVGQQEQGLVTTFQDREHTVSFLNTPVVSLTNISRSPFLFLFGFRKDAGKKDIPLELVVPWEIGVLY